MKTQSTKSSGQYEAKLNCGLHAANKSKLYDLNKSRKVSQKRLATLLEKNIFALRRCYICHECLQNYGNEHLDHKHHEDVEMVTEHLDNLVKNQILNISDINQHDDKKVDKNVEMEMEDMENSEQNKINISDVLVDAQDTDQESTKNLNQNSDSDLIKTYVNDINKLISKDVSKLYNEKPCKDAETLLSPNITEWIENRPINVVKHLQALCNLKDSKYENYLLAKIFEQIYSCRNLQLVLSLSF